MLDFADVVAINKFERRGGEDALRDVRRQMVRNRERVRRRPRATCRCSAPSPRGSTTTASPRSTRHLRDRARRRRACPLGRGRLAPVDAKGVDGHDRWSSRPTAARYLAEIADAVRDYHADDARSRPASPGAASSCRRCRPLARRGTGGDARRRLPDRDAADQPRRGPRLLDGWPADRRRVLGAEHVEVRDRGATAPRCRASRCRAPRSRGSRSRRFADHGELLRFLRAENLPGRFPFTAGVFPFKREGEDPARMFAGEGDAFRTNRRFHLLVRGPAGHPPVDRVRLGHPLRLRPRPSAPTSTARSATPACRSRPSTT